MNESKIQEAFSLHAHEFDEFEAKNNIVKWIRSEFRFCIEKYLKSNFKILDLGAGTGLDAIYYAKKGYEVHALENSPKMIEIIKQKKQELGLRNLIIHERSFMTVGDIGEKFDLIFSNFGVLNCTDDIETFSNSLSKVCHENTIFISNVMPIFSPWELINIPKNPKFGLQRLILSRIVNYNAEIKNIKFKINYYKPNQFVKLLGNKFKPIDWFSVCFIVPPPFLNHRVSKQYFNKIRSIESKLRRHFPFNSIGDSCIIVTKYIVENG